MIPREENGLKLYQSGKIEQLDSLSFLVHSQTRNTEYLVRLEKGIWTCDCPDITSESPSASTFKPLWR